MLGLFRKFKDGLAKTVAAIAQKTRGLFGGRKIDAASLEQLEEALYTADFGVTEEGRIRCGVCHHEVDPEGLDLTSLRRLEGASDPDDMQAVLALACPDCGARGTAVVHYGPDVGIGEARVLLAVVDERGGGPDPG